MESSGQSSGSEESTRSGSFALLFFSCFSLLMSAVLPRFFQTRQTPASFDANQSKRNPLALLFMLSQVIFALCMFATIFIKVVWQAQMLVTIVGLCWAVTMWVPFSLIGHYLLSHEKEQEQGLTAGIILGIHNIYIVLPGFISSALNALIFLILGNMESDTNTFVPGSFSDTFGWALRIGGIGSALAIYFASKIE
jgi:hypothetical protein